MVFADPDKKRAIEAGSPMPLGGPFEPLAAAQLLARLATTSFYEAIRLGDAEA